MKRILFFLAAMLLSGLALADDMIYREGNGSVRLTQAACTVPAALEAVKPEYAAAQKQGKMVISGRTIALCWLLIDGVVHTMDEDGDYAPFPVQVFKRASSI